MFQVDVYIVKRIMLTLILRFVVVTVVAVVAVKLAITSIVQAIA